MIPSFLKSCHLVAQTLCPIHIGSGDVLTPLDYYQKGQTIYVVDQNALLAWISTRPDAEKLASQLTSAIRVERKCKPFFDKFQNENLSGLIAYQVQCTGSPSEIRPFIKTLGNRVYLPGSSVKGSLRSGLFRGKIFLDKKLREAIGDIIQSDLQDSDLKHTFTKSDEIQARVFVKRYEEARKRPNFDINRLLNIRDSEAYPASEILEIVETRVYSVRHGSLGPKNFSIYVEAIRSGRKFNIPVVWQTHLLDENAACLGFSEKEELMAFLPEYCRQVSFDLLTQEMEFYDRNQLPELKEWFENKLNLLSKSKSTLFILPFGWGSGYDAKTITDLLGEEIFKEVTKKFKNTYGLGYPGKNTELEWLGPKDAPKSRKVVCRPDGRLEPMGWVEMKFDLPGDIGEWMEERRQSLEERKPEIKTSFSTGSKKTSVISEQPISKKTGNHLPKPQIIKAFSKERMPKPGDFFLGKVIYTEPNGRIYLEIPGLDPDEIAMAIVETDEIPSKKKYAAGKTSLCEVLTCKADPYDKNIVLVICRIS